MRPFSTGELARMQGTQQSAMMDRCEILVRTVTGTDSHGYRLLSRPITIGGTVAEPDTSDFYEMLDDAATDSKGVLGVGMRKINKKLQKTQGAKDS